MLLFLDINEYLLVFVYKLFMVFIKQRLLVIRLSRLDRKNPSFRAGQIICAASYFMDYFEATVYGLAVS